ncbi:hypothetical protein K474DRAFT_1704206 [Panus rudis PR-1116 ss-1]|nr:hypothetical protein K474DRAFT_1704206 [Panus rudis PR-1116 ss-1]
MGASDRVCRKRLGGPGRRGVTGGGGVSQITPRGAEITLISTRSCLFLHTRLDCKRLQEVARGCRRLQEVAISVHSIALVPPPAARPFLVLRAQLLLLFIVLLLITTKLTTKHSYRTVLSHVDASHDPSSASLPSSPIPSPSLATQNAI